MTPESGEVLRWLRFVGSVRIVAVEPAGSGRWTLGVVGLETRAYRGALLGAEELAGANRDLFVVAEAYKISTTFFGPTECGSEQKSLVYD